MTRTEIRERLAEMRKRYEAGEYDGKELYNHYETGERYERESKDNDYNYSLGQYTDIIREFDRERL